MAWTATDLDCFEAPFLTIIGDCSNTSTSGLPLNMLHGVTLKSAAQVANEEFRTGVNMLRQFEAEAINRVVLDVLAVLGRKYQFNKVLHTDVLGDFKTRDYRAVTGTVGFEVEVSDFRPYGARIQLQWVKFSVQEDVTGAVIYYEVDGVVSSKTVDLFALKQNTVQFNVEAERLIRVYWDPAAVQVGVSYINPESVITSTCDCRYTCAGCFVSRTIDVQHTGGAITSVSPSLQPMGMQAGINCVVRPDDLLCRYMAEIAQLVRLRVGMMMMWELLTSQRANPLVRNGRESAERLLARWEGTPDPVTGFDQKSEYYYLLNQLVNMMEVDLGQLRRHEFECTGYLLAEVRM
jgi:hypothetical protein